MTIKFKPIELADKGLIDSYSFRFGENSCQHSFVSMYGHFDKYGDSFFEKDGWLYLCRSHLHPDGRKVYLCPLGDPADENGFKSAIQNILEDAAKSGKKAAFETITKSAKERMEKAFPGRFSFNYSRDWCEYIFNREKLAKLPGKQMARRRSQYNAFCRQFEGRIGIEKIEDGLIPEILDFQSRWMKERMDAGDALGLFEENEAIHREVEEYSTLGLWGILIRIDGIAAGYAYGVPLSEDCFDVLCEKGDRKVANIYRMLKKELPELCDQKYMYFNWEEDVGDRGLRQMKMDYYPDILMEKYQAVETDE